MRAGVAALGIWAVLAGAASAQMALHETVDVARACERGTDRRVRLETVEGAQAVLECAVDEAGAPQSCALTFASPNIPTVRVVAMQQMCYGRRADAALVAVSAAGQRTANFAMDFDVLCSANRGVQVCAASRLRTRQLAGDAGNGG